MAADLYSSSATMGYATYEFAKAQECSSSNPDQIYYDKDSAYRNQDYRHVFHQEGTIGSFSIRLLEAADLSRHHWSALALGPMKHLGLSKAHGGVSSFVSFCLDTTPPPEFKRNVTIDDLDKKIPAKASINKKFEEFSNFVSPVVPNDNNPVWTNCQFEIPLKKGILQDGQPIKMSLRVDEDATALENMIPGIGSAGGASRLLGVGRIDVTALCLGQNPATGRPATGVIDTWIPIQLPEEEEINFVDGLRTIDEELKLQKKKASDDFDKSAELDSKAMCGRVRVLITYNPHGMKPQRNDIVALEAFARQNSLTASCCSVLPSLLPMEVKEVSEPWLLVKYCVPYEIYDQGFRDHTAGSHGNEDTKAFMRIHRNAVFVIERKNFLDGALNLALQPAEFVLNTPLGQGAREVLGPIIVASRQLLMPALLSSRLIWMAVRTTALAGITGAAAAGSAFVNEGANSLTRDGKRRPADENKMVRYV